MIWLFILLLVDKSYSQKSITDSVYAIKGIDIYSTRLETFAIGATVQKFDSTLLLLHKAVSISQLLSNSGANVKATGVSGLSTLSLRGGGSTHTTVIWNGLNIQSSMSGTTDFSNFPVSMFNSVRLQYGGSGTLFGSGAVAGVMHLSSGNILLQPNNVSVTTSLGSASTKSGLISIKQGNSRVAASIKAYLYKSDNDYSFINTTKIGSPKDSISNAEATQQGVTGDLAVKINKNITWYVAGWYQHSDKNLQTPISNTTPNESFQKDDQLYTSSNLRFANDKTTINLKNGYIYNKIDYNNPLVDIDKRGVNHLNTIVNEVESKLRVNRNNELLAGINFTKEFAYSNKYIESRANRDRLSAFGAFKSSFFSDKLTTVVSFRDELVDNGIIPLVASLGADYQVSKQIVLKGNISKNYRLPSLNDLYWGVTPFAQGNPDLKPESGWTGEISLNHKYSSQSNKFENSVTFFRTHINNWIIWQLNNLNKWQPQNFNTGKTFGVEINSAFAKKIGIVYSEIIGFYTYTHARVLSKNSGEKVMPYSPEHKFNGSINFAIKNFLLRYSHTFNYIRYVDLAGTNLPYYNLGDLSAGYKFKMGRSKSEIVFNINNIWNTNYQVTQSYAMPLRYYTIALNVDINTNH